MPRPGLWECHIFAYDKVIYLFRSITFWQLATRLWLSGIKLRLHQLDLYFAPYQGGGALQA